MLAYNSVSTLNLMCLPASGKQTDLGKAYQRWENLCGRLISIAEMEVEHATAETFAAKDANLQHVDAINHSCR